MVTRKKVRRKSDVLSLESFDAQQNYQDNQWRKHVLCCGSSDEAERKGYKTPKKRRPPAKRKKSGKDTTTALPSLAKEIAYWRRLFGLTGWKVYGIWRPLSEGVDGKTDIQSKTRRALVYVSPRVVHSGEFRETVCHEVLHVVHYEIHDALDGLVDEKLGDFMTECVDAAVERLAEAHMRLEKRRGAA